MDILALTSEEEYDRTISVIIKQLPIEKRELLLKIVRKMSNEELHHFERILMVEQDYMDHEII